MVALGSSKKQEDSPGKGWDGYLTSKYFHKPKVNFCDNLFCDALSSYMLSYTFFFVFVLLWSLKAPEMKFYE